LSRRRFPVPVATGMPDAAVLYLRALNPPLLVAVLIMVTAFGRLNLWLPLCFGKACESAASGPGLLPLLASVVALYLLSRERGDLCWQRSHWEFHRRTIMLGASAACLLLLAMIGTGDVPLGLVAGFKMRVLPPSLVYLGGLSLLTVWVLARCLVSAHAATACRPVAASRTLLW
jgi:hypothetical protein